MAKIDPKSVSKEVIQKAMACNSADELMQLAKAEGFSITKEEAEAYMAEMADKELSSDELKAAAGGCGWDLCVRSTCLNN